MKKLFKILFSLLLISFVAISSSGGQEKEWMVQESATVRAGKPDAVSVLKDGEAVEMPRSAGIGEITISAQPE